MHFRQKIPDPKIDSLAPARSVAPQPRLRQILLAASQAARISLTPALSPRRGGIIRRRLAATSDRTGSWSQCMRKNRKGAPHEPIEYSRLKDSPSPQPSPAGRGRIVRRWLETTKNKNCSGVQCAKFPWANSPPTGWLRRTIASVHGHNACEKIERSPMNRYRGNRPRRDDTLLPKAIFD